MKAIGEYDDIDEMEQRIIEIVRGQGEPEGVDYEDADTPEGVRELQALSQALLTWAMVRAGVDPDVAIDRVLDLEGNIAIEVTADGRLTITATRGDWQ